MHVHARTNPAGGSHTCALMTGGGIKCWGLNSNGQLGIGDSAAFKNIPVDVSLGPGVCTSAVSKLRRRSLVLNKIDVTW